jgi:hypothetical protein
VPGSIDSTLFSALERFKRGEASSEDLHLISAAFASGQIEIAPASDSNQILQSGGANFGESNEIRVTGSVIGTQIVSGFTAEQVQEIIENVKESLDDAPPGEAQRVNTSTILKIGGAITGLIVIVLIISLIIIRPPAIFPIPATKTPTPSITPLPPTSTPTPTNTQLPPTATPTPTATLTPTNTIPPPTDTPAPTQTPTQTPTPTDIPLIQDDFSTNSKGWYEGFKQNGSRFEARFDDQKYRLILSTGGYSPLPARYWSSVPNVVIDNFILDVEVAFEEGPDNSALLIGFHYDNFGSYYAVVIRPNLTYEIKLFLVDQDFNNPPPYFSGNIDNSIFNMGGENRIRIKVKDSKISIEFNDQLHLEEYQLPQGGPERGSVRLGVELFRVGRVAIIDFDDLTIHVAE